jgi:hypothetical protein
MFSENFSKKLRNNVGINGLISTLIGLLILFWPGRTAQVGTVLIGISFIFNWGFLSCFYLCLNE